MQSLESVLSRSRENDFHSRQRLVRNTVNRLDLAPDNAIVFGSAGLALHGLDAYMQAHGRDPFDLDAFITQAKLNSIAERFRLASFWVKTGCFNDKISLRRPLTQLPFSGFSGPLCDFGALNCYEATQKDSVMRDGVATLPAATLAQMKLNAGRRKDVTGLIQAHIIGHERDIHVVHESAWQETIATAIEKVQASGDVAHHGTARYPQWMADLASNQFNHPAFKGIAQ